MSGYDSGYEKDSGHEREGLIPLNDGLFKEPEGDPFSTRDEEEVEEDDDFDDEDEGEEPDEDEGEPFLPGSPLL